MTSPPTEPLESLPADAAPDPKPEPPATSATTGDLPAFGWSAYAERVNGRFAMLGFSAVVVIEALSHDTFLHWAGLVP
ncbi:MAG: chlorophyll a/b-binding protein [Cyanobacteriota bacterium]